jgi:hypothetical protein
MSEDKNNIIRMLDTNLWFKTEINNIYVPLNLTIMLKVSPIQSEDRYQGVSMQTKVTLVC